MDRDYRKEIGAETGDKTIPWPYALLLFAALAVVGWFGLRWLVERDHRAHPSPPSVTTNTS